MAQNLYLRETGLFFNVINRIILCRFTEYNDHQDLRLKYAIRQITRKFLILKGFSYNIIEE
jgi:hypothetical protein